MNQQEKFWTIEIGARYRADNDSFSKDLGISAWREMTDRIDTTKIVSYLECGSNIGRNISFLQEIFPGASASVIELNPESLEVCKSRYDLKSFFSGSIATAKFNEKFDLVFSCGVLIHVNPEELIASMRSMYQLTNRYILIAEYFNREPVSISYRGSEEKLFKRDFGKLFIENFQVNLVDCGFLWSHVYESAGFDDVTYWLFEKTESA
jgi:pseudaminic acid biosynthesis-associated methylase